MKLTRQVVRGFMAAAFAAVWAMPAGAQITTGSIGGTVRDATGKPMEGVQIQVVNKSTGFKAGAVTRENGRYTVANLTVGDVYTASTRRIGYQPVTKDNLTVTLGQTTPVDFQLTDQVAQLRAVTVTIDPTATFQQSRKGIEAGMTETMIQRTPSFSRDITSLTRFVPQVLTQEAGTGSSAGGAYNRYNTFTIDGANQSDKFNLAGSNGVPGGGVNGKVISMDAVKEFQVLLTPADVRQGNFVGMGVNMVTKNGTNEYKGSALYSWRNPNLGADVPFIRNSNLVVKQYGFTMGGPIIKDKLHFFVAPEFQDRTSPGAGQFIGANPATFSGLVSPDTIARIQAAMAKLGKDIGDGGKVAIDNPLKNIAARLDWQLNEKHRVVFRQLFNSGSNISFSRNNNNFSSALGVQQSGFRLTSNANTTTNKNQSSTIQVFSSLAAGATNELSVGYNTQSDVRSYPVEMPEISLPVARSNGTGQVALTFGTEQFSPNNDLRQKVLELTDNVTVPMGAHTLTAGARFERTTIFNNFFQRGFGVYKFNSITDLEAGKPLNYELGFDNGGGIPARANIHQYTGYVQDQWDVTPRLSLTAGLRVDVPQFLESPPQNDTIAARMVAAGVAPVNTSAKPKSQLLWSPRFGFNWDPTGDRKNQVRGTVGIFTAPPPFILVLNAYQNTGTQLVTLQCSGAAVPTFTVDIANLPRSCAGQPVPLPGQAGTAGINANDPNFKYPQYSVFSLGFDRALPFKTVFTFDGMYRKAINGLFIRDMNLIGPRMVGGVPYRALDGRILYADTITANGTVTTTKQRAITSLGSPAVAFGEDIIYLTNQSKDYNYTLTGQLKKKWSSTMEASVAYSYNRSMDVQSLTSDRAISNFRNGRSIDGLESEATLGTSAFERRHRVLFTGTWTMPWKSTDVTWFYEAVSGFPIAYHTTGDINGDGVTSNDAIYIPKNATDTTEMRYNNVTGFTAAQQGAVLENFIKANKCLDRQRGHIMERNSCTTPWTNRLDVSVRQNFGKMGLADALKAPALNNFVVQLDVFNFANLLNKKWGQTWRPNLSTFPQQSLLIVRGRTPGALNASYPIYEVASAIRTPTESISRNAGAFYRSQSSSLNFYQMQLTVRYQF